MNQEQQSYYLNTLGITRWLPRDEASIAPVAESTSAVVTWQALQAEVANCQACGLAQGRTQTVFGCGAQTADLLIVGEAPGYHEDQQGEPFVGRAGQLLNAMLASIGLSREQVYIANVLKCRPPENRDPLADEIRQCTGYLERQVALLQPKVILAVGRFAAQCLLDSKATLSNLRGQLHSYRDTNIPLIVSYHPAYLLRKPSDKGKAFIDLQLLHKTLTT